jgi:hypothetical protein
MGKLICFMIGHNYRHMKYGKLMKAWQHIRCNRCGRQLLLNHETKDCLPMDRELELAMKGE